MNIYMYIYTYIYIYTCMYMFCMYILYYIFCNIYPWGAFGRIGGVLAASATNRFVMYTVEIIKPIYKSVCDLPAPTVIVENLHCRGQGPTNRYWKQYLKQITVYW